MVYVYMNENFTLFRQGSDFSQNLKRCLLSDIVMRKQLRCPQRGHKDRGDCQSIVRFRYLGGMVKLGRETRFYAALWVPSPFVRGDLIKLVI